MVDIEHSETFRQYVADAKAVQEGRRQPPMNRCRTSEHGIPCPYEAVAPRGQPHWCHLHAPPARHDETEKK